MLPQIVTVVLVVSLCQQTFEVDRKSCLWIKRLKLLFDPTATCDGGAQRQTG